MSSSHFGMSAEGAVAEAHEVVRSFGQGRSPRHDALGLQGDRVDDLRGPPNSPDTTSSPPNGKMLILLVPCGVWAFSGVRVHLAVAVVAVVANPPSE